MNKTQEATVTSEETNLVPPANEDETSTQLTVEQWRAIRKEAGLKIDAETAEVYWIYAQTLDPYGIDPDFPEEYDQVGREYFARSPGSDIWVWFGDLPDATRDALWARLTPVWARRIVESENDPDVP
jgi:hypothetical protein